MQKLWWSKLDVDDLENYNLLIAKWMIKTIRTSQWSYSKNYVGLNSCLTPLILSKSHTVKINLCVPLPNLSKSPWRLGNWNKRFAFCIVFRVSKRTIFLFPFFLMTFFMSFFKCAVIYRSNRGWKAIDFNAWTVVVIVAIHRRRNNNMGQVRFWGAFWGC